MREPSEYSEQAALVSWLRSLTPAPLFFHAASERRCSPAEGARLKALGVRRGLPDLWIVTPPPAEPNRPGTVIELKRRSGGHRSPEQEAWMRALLALGWAGGFYRGADEAVQMLRALGYVRPGDRP